MNSQATVAVLLAVAVILFIILSSDVMEMLVGIPEPKLPTVEMMEAWKVIIAAIIGALSVYIAGGSDKK